MNHSDTHMTTPELLNLLRQLGVELTVHGDKLRYSAAVGTVTPALKAAIAERKLEIIRFLEESRSAEADAGIKRAERDQDLPLSFAQQRVWVLEQNQPGLAAYNLTGCFRFSNPLDRDALQYALNQVLKRHEALRTGFVEVDGTPVQRISEDVQVSLEVVETAADTDDAVLQDYIDKRIRQPFDLTQPPLIRAALLCRGSEHTLVLTIHHIACDEWSMGVLQVEIARHYLAYLQKTDSGLPELPVQYADYACWERERLSGAYLEQELAYWKEQLAGVQTLSLPTDGPRPGSFSFRGGTERAIIPAELINKLSELARQEQATLYMVLMAAFQVLLYRYSGQEKFAIGSPIANRTQVEVENLIGFFANTLVVKSDVAANQTFLELLRAVRSTTLESHSHQRMPFEKLVEALRPERTLSHNPIFQVAFAFQNVPKNLIPADLAFDRPTVVELETGTAKFDLTLFLRESELGVEAELEFCSDLFERETARRILTNFTTLLASIAANAEERIARLDLMRESERRKVAQEWNQTAADYPRDSSIPAEFERKAAETPDAVAVEFRSESLTYSELNRRANRLARYLQSRGIRPRSVVAIGMPRTSEMIVSILAALKSGCCYLPLDASYPAEHLEFLLRDSAAQAVVTDSEFLPRLAGAAAPVICVDTDTAAIAGCSEANLDVTPLATDLAYIMYTSGSQGQPKGVAVPHRGVLRLVLGTDYVPFGPDQVFLHAASPCFDASTLELWAPLLHGGRCVVFPSLIPTADELGTIIQGHGVNTAWLTSSLFNSLVDENVHVLEPLRHLLIGGEVISIAHVRRAQAALPELNIINGYGPTESTTFTTTYPIPRPVPAHWSSIPIGRPIANTRVYVLDPEMQPVPVGVRGELFIAGDGLADGYVNRKELTSSRFVQIEIPGAGTERLYRSGDFVRLLPTGDIEFIGRIDDQVKIRGYRIETGEIEVALSKHPSVESSTVQVKDDPSGSKRLVAYVVPARGQEIDTRELRRFLSAKLPEFMVPALYVPLKRMPLTVNGKVDRAALPAPTFGDCGSREFVSPRSNLELQLARMWEWLLNVEHVSVSDDFFELGGHSLLAVRMMSRIEKEFGKKLPLRVLFEAPTVEKLSEQIRAEGLPPRWPSVVPIRPHGTLPPLFCFHGIGGGVLNHIAMARHLPADLPVYGIQARGMDGDAAPHTSVEEMVADYLNQIRDIQPHGPYYMTGFSFGGVLAFEAARSLQAQGEEIGMLALVDSGALGISKIMNPLQKILYMSVHQWRRLLLHAGNLTRSTWKQRVEYIRGRFKKLQQRTASVLWQRKYQKYATTGQQLPQELRSVREANFFAASRYVPTPYSGSAVLLRAEERAAVFDFDPTMGWGALVTGGLKIRDVPGSHDTMHYQENAIYLAKVLAKCIEEVHALRSMPPAEATSSSVTAQALGEK